jgi:hypothetical protein
MTANASDRNAKEGVEYLIKDEKERINRIAKGQDW